MPGGRITGVLFPSTCTISPEFLLWTTFTTWGGVASSSLNSDSYTDILPSTGLSDVSPPGLMLLYVVGGLLSPPPPLVLPPPPSRFVEYREVLPPTDPTYLSPFYLSFIRFSAGVGSVILSVVFHCSLPSALLLPLIAPQIFT